MAIWDDWVEALVNVGRESGYTDINLKDFGVLPVVIEFDDNKEKRITIGRSGRHVVVHFLDDVADGIHFIYLGRPEIIPTECLNAFKTLLGIPGLKPR